MAIYGCSVKVIARGDRGRSAVAAAAYRSGSRLVDVDGREYDYSPRTRSHGVLASWISAPAGAPAWALDREQLWCAVETVEKRQDAQLAREAVLALPHELSHEQRRELVEAFVEREFVARGMVADVAMHAADREGDSRNHHAHVMLTLRKITPEGAFGNKAREWNAQGLVPHWREAWAAAVNAALDAAGVEARVDHRSLAAQREEALARGDLITAEELDRPAERKAGIIAIEDYRRSQRTGEAPRTERGRELAEVREYRAVVIELAQVKRELAAAEAAEAEAAAAAAAAAAAEPEPQPRPRMVAGLGLGLGGRFFEAARAEAEAARSRPAPVLVPVPAPAPVFRPAAELEALLAEGERLLALVEERRREQERARLAWQAAERAAVEARRAAEALRGSWLARTAARVGLGPLPAAERRLAAAEAELRPARQDAEQRAMLTGLAQRRLDAIDVLGVQRELEAARGVEQQWHVAAVDQVIALVIRAHAAVPYEKRGDWHALRVMDRVGGIDELRARLGRDSGLAITLAHDLGERRRELEQLEAALEQRRLLPPVLEDEDQGDDQGGPAPA